jgi:hypothetical protein
MSNSNSKMILCGKPSVLKVFEGGETGARIPEDGANIVYGEVMLRDLIPLSWKVPPVIQNGNDPTVSMVAAELLGARNAQDLLADFMRRIGIYSKTIAALPGDFVVVMPLAGLDNEVRCNDTANSRDWFGRNTVKVAFVGKELPPDVAQVYRHVQWNTLHIEQPDLIGDAIKAGGKKKVTVFDALRLQFCTGGVEEFQRKHFPGRTEVTVDELVPHLDNAYVRRLVRHQLGLMSKESDSCEMRRKNLRPLAQALGVNDRRWL